MAANSKRRPSSKKIYIFFLRALLFLGFVLLFGTLALQIANVLLPAAIPEETPPTLGVPSNAFAFTKENLFPFLLAPLLVLIVCYLYLKKYLTKNNISAMDHIPYFRKHPHTLFGRKFYNAFSVGVIGCSVLFAVIGSVCNGIHESWFGTFTAVGCVCLLTFASKTLRHTRRQYFAHRKKKADAGENNR